MTALDDFADMPEVAALLQLAKADPEECHCFEATEALEAMADVGVARLEYAERARWQRDYERGLNEVLCIVARKHGEMLRSCEEELDEECTRAERAEALNARWNKATSAITPGGSEFIDEPERVVDAVRSRFEMERKFGEKKAERAEAERDEADDRAAYLKGQLLKAKPVTCGECKYMHSGVHGITQWAYCGCEESPMWKYGVDPWGYADFSCSLGKRKDSP